MFVHYMLQSTNIWDRYEHQIYYIYMDFVSVPDMMFSWREIILLRYSLVHYFMHCSTNVPKKGRGDDWDRYAPYIPNLLI